MISCKLSRYRRLGGIKGFSLVELLIVVAIIGVLSTVGVPTFRRMVTRSKKTEAKTTLAGLFTAESAFYTEYNTYGNYLAKVGFDIEGNRRLYDVGFTNGTCQSDATALPPAADPIGIALKQAYNTYYDDYDSASDTLSSSYPRSQGRGGACGGASAAAETTYTAAATGNIAPGIKNNATVTAGCKTNCQDVWTMTHQRILSNTVDGTN